VAGRDFLAGETPLWLIVLGILALIALILLFWQMRSSLGRSLPFPDDERVPGEDEPYKPFWAKIFGPRRR
jgi:hypothetical protein